ncbi:MAG: carbohydrate-binding protein [Verrucomicrobiales bacterium]|nr:carbohydrate-binding protein [Verrucomicrobiales bacterium]
MSRKSNGTGVGTLHLELDGEPLGAPFTIEPTGDWQSYANISHSGVSLPTGTHVLRVAFDESLPEQYLYIVNLDYVEFSREGPPLGIHRGAADSIVISWPASASGWELEENRDLGTDQWSIVGSVPVEVGDNLEVTISPGKTEGYYRLRKP